MCQADTGSRARRLLLVSVAACAAALAQTASDTVRPDWRKVGSTSLEVMLASPATGPVDQVWFGPDARTLFARTRTGRVFETIDFENWNASTTLPPRPEISTGLTAERLPAPNAVLRANPADARRIYAIANHLYESEDGGHSWTNLTAYKDQSVIGPGQHDLAVSPADANHLIVANDHGVWRSLDGGQSWSGLNRFLPNLIVRRILALPVNGRGLQIEVDGLGPAELPSGGGAANSTWQLAPDAQSARDAQTRRAYSAQLGAEYRTPATLAGALQAVPLKLDHSRLPLVAVAAQMTLPAPSLVQLGSELTAPAKLVHLAPHAVPLKTLTMMADFPLRTAQTT